MNRKAPVYRCTFLKILKVLACCFLFLLAVIPDINVRPQFWRGKIINLGVRNLLIGLKLVVFQVGVLSVISSSFKMVLQFRVDAETPNLFSKKLLLSLESLYLLEYLTYM